jgi:hypothetical protein
MRVVLPDQRSLAWLEICDRVDKRPGLHSRAKVFDQTARDGAADLKLFVLILNR